MAAAREFFGADTLYCYLAEGDSFHFPKHPECTYTKRARGWYSDVDGRRYRTGVRTAVLRVDSNSVAG